MPAAPWPGKDSQDSGSAGSAALLLLTFYIPLQAGNAIFVSGAVPVLLIKCSSERGEKREFWCIMTQTLTPDRPSNPLIENSVE